MGNQHIVRDMADRSGAAFGRRESKGATPTFVKVRASAGLANNFRQLADSVPMAPSLRNVAELKIHIDGLPIVVFFPMEDVPPKGPADVNAGHTDMHSLVSNAIRKIADRLRGSGVEGAFSRSNAAPTFVDMTPVAAVSAQTVLRVGPLELNLLDRTAKRGERTIDLRPREFKLLRYMMERSDKLLTRAKLLQEVWNYKFVPQTNLVDVHMGRLRRKLDGPNGPAMIRSVRGAGFVLDSNPLPKV
jgi:DNA-binding winged helix-turn-helix (wHTH) protein